MIVALVGPRCSGKTSVGRELARRLRWPFVDLDDELAGRPAGELLAEIGESTFRDLEEKALRTVLERGGPMVLACGGGVVERDRSRELLARRTTCVWLRASPAELARRMRGDPTRRPSLTGANPVDEIEAILARREPLYAEVASIAIDGRGLGIDEIAKEVATRIGRGNGPSGCRG